MKIYTKTVIDMASGEMLESESFDYTGPVAECKGGVSTTTVTSPQAEQALGAVMPALERIGQMGSIGAPLYNVPQAPIGNIAQYYGGAGQAMMPSAANIGAIDPNIQRAVAQPYEQAMGQIVEKFGGGMGSARGGLSGAGAKVLQDSAQQLIPQYTKSLWDMISPGLSASAMGGAQAASNLAGQQWGAEVAARQAPFGPITQIGAGTMPTTLGGVSKK